MKEASEYWVDAFTELGVDADTTQVGLRALEKCIRDHDLFVQEMSERTDSLVIKIAEVQATIRKIMEQIPSEDQTP